MSWIFPPEGCDGTPINTALVRHYHCAHGKVDEGVICFAFTEDDWSTWTFQTKEARDAGLKEINAKVSGDPLKGRDVKVLGSSSRNGGLS